MLPTRQPHPVPDLATAIRNRREICDRRGYCGPFFNSAYYDAFPDPLWAGSAECIHCRSTVNVENEERKRVLATAGFRQVRAVPAPKIRRPPYTPSSLPVSAGHG